MLPAASASPGLAVGAVVVLNGGATDTAVALPEGRRDAELERASAALATAAERLVALARRLDGAEAEIVEAGAMMARDPAMLAAVSALVLESGMPAPLALTSAAEEQAAVLASIDDPMLAARAEDVRSVGRRAARIASGVDVGSVAGAVVVADDVGPADVAELADDVVAFALAGGAVTGHAAIVARARGIPMVVTAGAELLSLTSGAVVVVDSDGCFVVLDPTRDEISAARAAMDARSRAHERALAERDLPAVTRDGRQVAVLTNAASAAEVRAGLAAGAEGAGLVRTELAFLDAGDWPTQADHERALGPVLAPLAGRLATVRVLDFGADKTPPFLAGTRLRGLRLMLASPGALENQMAAIQSAGQDCDLRILIPMVESAEDVAAVRAYVSEGAAVGAMIETPEAVAAADEIAAASTFLSIGTNDLTASVLGADRFASNGEAVTWDPRVLRAVDHSARAARNAGIPIEVCGEAASEPVLVPLLIGLGIDELSVGAARVGAVRAWVRGLSYDECAELAAAALVADSAADVAQIVTPASVATR